MPTINQLVRKSRQDKVRKSKSPQLGVGLNTLKKVATDVKSPQKRGVCTRVSTAILGLKVDAVQGKQVSLEWTETSRGFWEWWLDRGVPLAFPVEPASS